MTKKLLIIIGAAAAIVVLGIGIYQTDASQKNQPLSEGEISDVILSQYPGEIKTIALDDGYNQPVYDIKIVNEGIEYELKVDGISGEIKQLKELRTLTVKEGTDHPKESAANDDSEKEQSSDKKTNTSAQEEKPKTSIEKQQGDTKQEQHEQTKKAVKDKDVKNKKAVISKEEAIRIALNEFSGKIDDIDLEEENGRLIYEIEIERDEMEAEIEIDAYTGEVILLEIDD